MNDDSISRRQMIKMSSVAALTTVASPALAVPKKDSPDLQELSKNEICFTNAVDLAALLRKKKISAREVIQARSHRTGKLQTLES